MQKKKTKKKTSKKKEKKEYNEDQESSDDYSEADDDYMDDEDDYEDENDYEESTTGKSNLVPYVIGAILLVVVVFMFMNGSSGNDSTTDVTNPGQYGSTDVTLYVMSQCPYGIQAENAFAPVLEELGDNINFRLEYIANEAGGQFQSLHGEAEVLGNKVQLCVQKYYTSQQLMDFVICQNTDVRDLRASIGKCAQQAGIDSAKIVECADGAEGSSLLSESLRKAQAAQARGSPTIYIGGTQYSGSRDASAFKRAVCKDLPNHPTCQSIPTCNSDADCTGEPGKIGSCENPGEQDASCTYTEDEQVRLIVVNAKECTTCDATQLIAALRQVFFNMDVKEIDVDSEQGAQMVSKFGLTKAPSFVFMGNLENTYAWNVNPNLPGAFRKVGDYYIVLDEASGANYLLDPAERKKMEELVGVKKGDNTPQIDFYVMSYCPYGNIAEEAIESAYQLLGDKAEFNPHYVIYSNYQGGGPVYCKDAESKYCSMHGVQELNQNIRELCVNKYFGTGAYFEFVLAMNDQCSAQNADACWTGVANSIGLDTAKIKTCEETEWETLLEKEAQLNSALGVSGSPTVFVEGAAYGGARTPAGYAQALCSSFETAPSECSADNLASLGTVDTATAAATAAGACG